MEVSRYETLGVLVETLGAQNTATFANPISCGANSLTAGAINGSQLTVTGNITSGNVYANGGTICESCRY
jgi:hypothetical protein